MVSVVKKFSIPSSGSPHTFNVPSLAEVVFVEEKASVLSAWMHIDNPTSTDKVDIKLWVFDTDDVFSPSTDKQLTYIDSAVLASTGAKAKHVYQESDV